MPILTATICLWMKSPLGGQSAATPSGTSKMEAPVEGLEELGQRNAKRRAQGRKSVNGCCRLPALELADKRSMKACMSGELFLREPLMFLT